MNALISRFYNVEFGDICLKSQNAWREPWVLSITTATCSYKAIKNCLISKNFYKYLNYFHTTLSYYYCFTMQSSKSKERKTVQQSNGNDSLLMNDASN